MSRTHRVRALLSATVVSALALGGIVAAGTSASAVPAEGSLSWGFRQGFRSYVGGQFGAGSSALPEGERITVRAPATFDADSTPSFGGLAETKSYTLPVVDTTWRGAEDLRIDTAGGVTYAFPAHHFTVSVSDVSVIVAGGVGRLEGDVEVVVHPGFTIDAGTYGGTDVVFGDVGEVAVTRDGSRVSVTGSDVTLTEAGATALQDFLAAGDPLDAFALDAPVRVPAITAEVDGQAMTVVTPGETITVTGSGFDPDLSVGKRPPFLNQRAGFYVVVGKFAETWQPSAGAGSAARTVLHQRWAIPEEQFAAVGSTNVQYAELNEDGTFTLDLASSIAPADAGRPGKYGIYTYGGSGAAVPVQETFTPITFAGAPSVTSAPTNARVVDGAAATFSVAASGANNTYQWETLVPGASKWIDVAGATADTVTVSATAALNGAKYRAVVLNAVDNVASDAATLSVIVAPRFTTAPASQAVVTGQNALFTAAVVADDATYQWESKSGGGEWKAEDGATTATLVIRNVTSADTGTQYRLVVTNAAGTVVSSAAVLTVNPAAPVVTANPVSVTTIVGQDATFSAVVDAEDATLQWESSTDGENWTNIDGATSDTLVVSDVARDQSGTQYRLVASNVSDTAVSAVATLTVNAVAPVVTVNPTSLVKIAGQDATFTAAFDAEDATLQWQLSANGGSTWVDISGATSATLVVRSVKSSESGTQYRLVVTNVTGTVRSGAATLTVNPVAPVVSSAPKSVSVAAGATAQLAVVAAGEGVSLQWEQRASGASAWSKVAGATSARLAVKTSSVAQSGTQYRVVATNRTGSVTSAAATLTITKAAASVSIASSKKLVKFASKPKVTVTVKAPSGVAVGTGTVTVKSGKTTVGTGKVKNGKATVTLSTKLRPATKRALVATYTGDANLAKASSKALTLKVSKATAKVTLSVAKKVKASKRAKVTVKVSATGTTPTGKVVITATKGKTKRTFTKTLSKGKTTVKLSKLARGTWKVKVAYKGSALVSSKSSATKKLIVTK